MDKRAKIKAAPWVFGVALLGLSSVGCSVAEPANSVNNREAPLCDRGPTPTAYCSTTTTYSSGVTINGTAKFEKRPFVSGTGLGSPGTPDPIRHAEIRVTDSSGSVVQCAETDGSGNFSFDLPNNSNTYTINVMARAKNSKYKAAVMDAPEQNNVYKISDTVVPNAAPGSVDIVASATGSLKGGAFNILDQIYESNEFLRSSNGTGDSSFVAPDVSIYWEKGFNPASYFGSSSSGLSFYLPGQSCLFILGGLNGDTDNEDTDHYDDSVIIHEYGHFIEDVLTNSDSPGGAHSGNKIIDPRLAWGEAWGNFFQSAVLNRGYYTDTKGNVDGTAGIIFDIPLESYTADSACSPSSNPGCDQPTDPYEGHFREFAITRMLWDMQDTSDDDSGNASATNETVNTGFPDLWKILRCSERFLNPNAAFRSVGLVLESKTSDSSPCSLSVDSWATLLDDEAHRMADDRTRYGLYVDESGSNCSINPGTPGSAPTYYTIDGENDTADDGSFDKSNLFYNNRFYHYKHTSGSTLTMRYQLRSGSTKPDLDLYLYKEDGAYGSSSALAGRSEEYFTANTVDSESISLSDIPSGHYLINVKIYTGTNTDSVTHNGVTPGSWFPEGDLTEFDLKVDGVNLCQTALP